MTILSSFEPNQIVCVEQGDTKLFAEVIQVSEIRPVSWIRPLLMCSAPLDWNRSETSWQEELAAQVYDLREGTDLLWPLELQRAALDTEVVPLLTKLSTHKAQSGDRSAHQCLQAFIRQVWQAYPNAFRFESNQSLNQQTLD